MWTDWYSSLESSGGCACMAPLQVNILVSGGADVQHPVAIFSGAGSRAEREPRARSEAPDGGRGAAFQTELRQTSFQIETQPRSRV